MNGAWVNGQTCYARNGGPSDGVFAYARCCDFSGYSVSCTTYISDQADNVDNAKTIASCTQSYEEIMGWYATY